MRVQQQISEDVQARKVGRTMKVIIDREEGDYFIGRTEYDSPEVDPEVLIKKSESSDLRPGFFYAVNISSADEFDLFAKVE
jgi:ribosomal protein S12 methylthiotransferase